VANSSIGPHTRGPAISVNGRPVADKARRNPEAREEVGRGVNGRGHDLGSVLVQRSVHLAAPGIDPGRNRRGVAAGLPIRSPRERVERRDADEWLSLREREPLHRRDADAQPGKRSGAGGDRVEVDLRELGKRLNAGSVSFASPDRLRAHLGVEPGSVTPLAAWNDREGLVTVVIDAALMASPSEKVHVHPLTNDRTTSLRADDLVRFLASIRHDPMTLTF